MIKFSECTISKAVEHGTNLSCIKGRTIVCKVIKDFVVDRDNNIVKFEEGDIIVCSPNMDIYGDECIGLCLSEESYIKSLSSDSFIKRNEADFWQYKVDCSLEQFKETFEVLDEETAALESCIEKSKSCYNFLWDKKMSVYCVQRKYQSKAKFRQGALGVTLLIVGAGTFTAALTVGCSTNAFSRYMEKAPLWIAVLIIMFILGSLVMGAILCLFLSEKDAFECFECKKTPLLDKAEEKYKEHRSNTINELDAFRRKIGWGVERECEA